jgi:hypothetical protein
MTYAVEKSSPTTCATSAILTKLPKVNNHPLGENSPKNRPIWGRCYDHHFLRFSTAFGEKIGVFLKNQCYDQNFCKNKQWVGQKTPIFSLNFSPKIFKKS